jgi:hypothetical protein
LFSKAKEAAGSKQNKDRKREKNFVKVLVQSVIVYNRLQHDVSAAQKLWGPHSQVLGRPGNYKRIGTCQRMAEQAQQKGMF